MFFLALALLVLAAGILVRLRIREGRRDGPVPEVTDELVDEIERRGTVEGEEPLDYDRIREEEDRFWNETWDRPESLW